MLLKSLLMLVYGALCIVEFLVTWAKDKIQEEVTGKPTVPPEEEDG